MWSIPSKKFRVNEFVAIVLIRDWTKSVADKIKTDQEGIDTQDDAAFAGYIFDIGLGYNNSG